MGQVSYNPRQQSVWCKTVIRNTASKLRRKHRRWAKDKPVLNLQDENGEEYQNHIVSQAGTYGFEHVEWNILLEEVLTPSERCVIQSVYMADQSQRDVAKACLLSQSGVSRTKQQALQKLRRAMIR